MKPSDFKVGDRVRIVTSSSYPDYNGTTGTVYDKDPRCCCIQRDSDKVGLAFRYDDCQIELVKDWQAAMISDINAQLSPQLPQQQTTQQKEDTVKPYAVIYQNFTQQQQQGNFTGFYATEIEAKEAAELLAAAQRANLQVKQYFSITVINTKTGKLIGSVVDAPPAVDWAAS